MSRSMAIRAWLLRCSAAPSPLPCRPADGVAASDVTPGPDSGLNVRTRVQVSPWCRVLLRSGCRQGLRTC